MALRRSCRTTTSWASLEATVRYLACDLGPKQVRVNAISAGPVNTLAARGVSGFSDMLRLYPKISPMQRNIQTSELGCTALFLASDWGGGITGEVVHVDCGYHAMGMPPSSVIKPEV